MPTVGLFHTFYWENTSTVVTPVITARPGGYPTWQSAPHATTICSTIVGWPGAVPVLIAKWWAVTLWAISFAVLAVWTSRRLPTHHRARLHAAVKDLAAFDPERLAVLERTIAVLNHPLYGTASASVRQTATTLGFNRPEAWVKLSHTLKDHQGWAENSWRHLHACHLTDEAARAQGSTLSNRDRHFAVALAYEGMAAAPRKTTLRPARA